MSISISGGRGPSYETPEDHLDYATDELARAASFEQTKYMAGLCPLGIPLGILGDTIDAVQNVALAADDAAQALLGKIRRP
jgi:hypothetical protein